jgi:anaerobic magnesium-protoporphyrin IX monomethyl ester cyclase
MFSSRGCSNLCIYCFQIYRDRHIRYRSAENVVAEIEECINKYGIKEIKFLDDQFTGNYERVEKICNLIVEKKLDITWYTSAIANTVDKKLHPPLYIRADY